MSLKFPDPNKRSPENPALHCPPERVLGLHNQAHPNEKPKVRVSKKVKEWFVQEAHNNGWAGASFMPSSENGAGAGCVLFVPTNNNAPTILVIADGGGVNDAIDMGKAEVVPESKRSRKPRPKG